jgi:hypothetical protein
VHLCYWLGMFYLGVRYDFFNSSEPSKLETFLPSLWPIGSPFTFFFLRLFLPHLLFFWGWAWLSFFWKWVLDLHIWQQLAI